MSPAGRSARRGVTLAELLVAMMVTTVLIIAIASLYRKTQAQYTAQNGRIETRRAPLRAIESVRDDLMRAYDAGRPDTRLVLTQELGSARLDLTTIERSGGTNAPMSHRIGWSVQGASGIGALTRTHRPLSGPGSTEPPVTNQVLDGVVRFSVDVQDGTNWQTSWPLADSNQMPRLARVTLERLAKPSNETWSVMTWIPTGHRFAPPPAR